MFGIAHKPDVLLHIDSASGEVRAVIDDIGAPMYAIDTVAALPNVCLCVGAKETIMKIEVL